MSPADVEKDFEAWAQLAARLRLRTPDERRTMLRDLGLAQAWDEIHENWARRLNQEIAAGRMDMPYRYARICAREAGARAAAAAHAPPPEGTPSHAGRLSATSHADGRSAMVSAVKAKEAVEHWSVEQYARLCAQLARAQNDDQRQAIWETVGVMRPPEQQWVQQQWAERLAFDPALFSAWTEALARG
jgi:hypothetical protein